MTRRMPVTGVVYSVALDEATARELRRKVGTQARAAEIECESCFDPPPDTRLIRVEADAPVGVFVNAGTWPYGGFHADDWDAGRRSAESGACKQAQGL